MTRTRTETTAKVKKNSSGIFSCYFYRNIVKNANIITKTIKDKFITKKYEKKTDKQKYNIMTTIKIARKKESNKKKVFLFSGCAKNFLIY